MSDSISAAAITDAGYTALVHALSTGGKINPKTARVSATAYTINRSLEALNDYWWEGDISLVNVIDVNTYEARVIIPPDQASDYMRTVGLYLADGTLFAVSAAKDIPPGVGQEIVIQLTYRDIVSLTDFQYLGWQNWEDYLAFLAECANLSNGILENARAIGLLESVITSGGGGDANSQMLENAQDIDALQAQMATNITNINVLQGQVSGNAGNITALGEQVSTNTDDISTLQGQVSGQGGDLADVSAQVDENTSNIDTLLNAIPPTATLGGQSFPVYLRKVIDTDMTFTCTPASSGADFCGPDALAQALVALQPYTITAKVVVKLGDGVYGAEADGTWLQSVVLRHPDISHITIQGNVSAPLVFNLANAVNAPDPNSGIVYVPNPDGVYSLSDIADPNGNDYIARYAYLVSAGKNDGLYTVTNTFTAGTDIAVDLFEGLTDGTKAGTIYFPQTHKCLLQFADDIHGFIHQSMGQAKIEGVAIYGPGGLSSNYAFYANKPGQSFAVERVSVRLLAGAAKVENGAAFSTTATDYSRALLCFSLKHAVYAYKRGTADVSFAVMNNCGDFYADRLSTIMADQVISTDGTTPVQSHAGSKIYIDHAHFVRGYRVYTATLSSEIFRTDNNVADDYTTLYFPTGTLPIQGPDGSRIF